MKTFVLFVAVIFSSISLAADRKITYQTLPGSSTRDYSAPAYVTEGDITYRTMPGSTTRDYSAPTYVTKGNTTYKKVEPHTRKTDGFFALIHALTHDGELQETDGEVMTLPVYTY